jgi:phage gpG-like protein
MLAVLEGADELAEQLASLPGAMLARLEAKAQDLAAALVEKVREEKLSGALLQVRSGDLKASIAAQISISGTTIDATVGSFGDVKYAAIQEYGGHTAPHEILPEKAQALAFVAGGQLRFARRVEHPGSAIPAKAYLGSSLEEARDGIVAELSSVAQEAWDNR